jgi:hypothetical protein
LVIWSVRFSTPDLSTVQKSLRTTSIFSIGLITVLVASRSLPAMATDGKDLTLNDDGKGAHATRRHLSIYCARPLGQRIVMGC